MNQTVRVSYYRSVGIHKKRNFITSWWKTGGTHANKLHLLQSTPMICIYWKILVLSEIQRRIFVHATYFRMLEIVGPQTVSIFKVSSLYSLTESNIFKTHFQYILGYKIYLKVSIIPNVFSIKDRKYRFVSIL